MAYSDLEHAWPYQDVQEVALPHAVDVLLGVLVIPTAMFSMGLFLLVAGLLTPGSLARKGLRRFVRDRLMRLGIPLAFWVLAIWPALVYAVHRAAGEHGSYWSSFTGAHPFLDTGPPWFVEVLLLYSLAYAWWRARWAAPRVVPIPLTPRTLAWLAVAVSAATLLVRLVFPIGSQQPAHPNLWQWPQYVALFGLGVVAAERGWLRPVPRDVPRRSGRMAGVGVAAFLALGVALAATDTDGDVLFHGRLHWARITLAVIEGPLAVGASVWVLARRAAAPRRADRPHGARPRAQRVRGIRRPGRRADRTPDHAAARRGGRRCEGAGGRALGTTGSFALAWLLVTRTLAGRVL